MDEEDFVFGDYFNFNVTVLRALFYWPPEKTWPKRRKILYTIYSVCMVTFMMACYNLSEYVNMINAIGDFDKILKAVFLVFTNTAQSIKLTVLACKFTQIKKLIQTTGDEIFKPLCVEHLLVLKRSMHSYKMQAALYFVMAFNVCFLWMVFPLIDAGSEGRQLPFDTWYPFEVDASPRYEIIYAYQITSMGIHATINVATDNTCYGFMVFACAQLDILNDVLRNLRVERIGIPQEEASSRMDKLLKESIGRHRAILRFVNEIVKAYTFIVVSQFVFGSVIICISMYQLAQSTLDTVEFWASLSYLLCMMGQLFFYCWHGNEITQKSENLFRSAYMCDWVGSSATFRRNLLTFMTRLSRPIRVNPAFFFTLSVETYMAIIRCSWSYFAVLQSVEEK